MNIAISGASGFIGSNLCTTLRSKGHTIFPISREILDLGDYGYLTNIIGSCEVVINLAGASIANRWSRRYKREIIESRLFTTRRIVNAINQSPKTKLLISASAAGYAPEDSLSRDKYKSTFLERLCHEWEAEANRVKPSVRVVCTRFGVVFSMDGGALPKMIETKSFGFITQLGPANRIMSWIDIEDIIGAIEHIIYNEQVKGAINLVSPEATTQHKFITLCRERFSIPMAIRIPTTLLRLLVGRGYMVILHEHCASPQKLLESGYSFHSPDIETFFLK